MPSKTIDSRRKPSTALDSHRLPSAAIENNRQPSIAVECYFEVTIENFVPQPPSGCGHNE